MMADTVITLTQLRRQFSKIVDRAAAGECFTITRRGVPCVRLTPVRTVDDLVGSVPYDEASLSVDEMNDAIAKGVLERNTIKSSDP